MYGKRGSGKTGQYVARSGKPNYTGAYDPETGRKNHRANLQFTTNNQYRMIYLYSLIIRLRALPVFVLLLLTPAAWAQETLVLQPDTSLQRAVAAHQTLALDDSKTLTIEDVLAGRLAFRAAPRDVVNLGYRDSAAWIHLHIANQSDSGDKGNWILEIAFARLTRVDIFLAQKGVLVHRASIGNERPMSARRLKHNFFAEALPMQPGQEYDLYINVTRNGGGVQVPVRFYQPEAFSNYVAENNIIYGIYFGIMFAMLVYNSFLLLSVGNRAYLYYICHIAGVALSFQIIYGYAFKYLWPETPFLNDYGLQIAVIISSFAGLLFTRHYIEIERYQRWMNHLVNVLLLMGAVLLGIRLLTNNPIIAATAMYVGMNTLAMLTISFICWRQGSRPAGFFLLAWSLFLAGAAFHLLTLAGILPNNTVTTFAVVIGSALEVLLLSLGLADRINNERRARYLVLQEKHQATMELKMAEERLVQRALHSATTGLPNRALLRSVLEQFCNRQPQQPLALVLLSLDNFHEFNKTLGHHNGDAILNIIAQDIVQTTSRNSAILPLEHTEQRKHSVACIEGVTFAFLLDSNDEDIIFGFCNQLINQIELPFEYQGLMLDVSASVGIALHPAHGAQHEDLLRNAHIALEMAANSGSHIALYSRDMDPYNARRISLLAELREAIGTDRLQLHLQPQISLQDQTVVGVEVLVRWPHPEHGFIPPTEFIPLAERTGVIHPLTYWVCRKSFALCRELHDAGIELNFSINISVRNLQAAGFTQKIAEFAKAANVPVGRITMELTETAVMVDHEDALKVMNELAAIGIRLSIDDFGTGYSSLSYLKQLPVHEIKIDRSFVTDMLANNDDRVIVQTTLAMGHNLGLRVVAEGIEDQKTLTELQAMGCDTAQGYHIAKPMKVEDFRNWMQSREPAEEMADDGEQPDDPLSYI